MSTTSMYTKEPPRLESVEVDAQKNIIYPDSDGAPMGETGIHAHATLSLYYSLYLLFYDHPEVYVAADMFLYYKEGDPKANKAPDVMVIKGVGNHHRRSFKIWEEGVVPCVIVEVTSKSTMTDDMMTKMALYSSLGVQEYFLFDPLREYLDEALIGGRLDGGVYFPIIPDDNARLFSQELNVFLSVDNYLMRLSDPQTGRLFPHLNDSVEQMEEAMQQAKQAVQRAEQEAQRAEQEKLRAEAAEAELARLRIKLAERE